MFDELIEKAEGVHADDSQPQAEEENVSAFERARRAFMEAVRERILDIKTDPNIDLDDIDLRSSTAIRHRWIRPKVVCVVGIGGLGNWLWRILAGMGIEKLILIDNDTIEIQNVGPQAHSLAYLGYPKVLSAADSMMAYRGVEIRTVQTRVRGLEDIRTICGGMPDILITCVDNMEFRNTLNGNIKYVLTERSYLPEIYIDMRMSLGDWRIFTLPLRTLAMINDGPTLFTRHFYEGGAVFAQSNAVQEACTERAIVYTGANAAAYVGAMLHWYTNEGQVLFSEGGTEEHPNRLTNIEQFMYPTDYWPYEFSMDKAFSARDWEPISPTRAQRVLQRKLREFEGEITDLTTRLQRSEDNERALQAELINALAELDTRKAVQMPIPPAPEPEPDPIPAPAPASCVARRPRPAPVVSYDEVQPGGVLVFDDMRVYVEDVTATFVVGMEMADGDTERLSNRAVSGMLAYYPTYGDYEASEDFQVDDMSLREITTHINDRRARTEAADASLEELIGRITRNRVTEAPELVYASDNDDSPEEPYDGALGDYLNEQPYPEPVEGPGF